MGASAGSHRPSRWLGALSVLVLASCAPAEAQVDAPSVASAPDRASSTSVSATAATIGPVTPTDPTRISPFEQAAVERLGDPAGTPVAEGHGHGHGAADAAGSTVPLDAAESELLAMQWYAAQWALDQLDSLAELEALGYVTSAAWGPGIGTHFVKWSLVGRPFDPTTPAMVLVDDRPGRPWRTVGYSYWAGGEGGEAPEGFAGSEDRWHSHAGLCIVNGWLDDEDVPSPSECAGTWIAGGELWMLHAWVNPDLPSRAGRFAERNPALCPPAVGTADIARCADAE